MIQIFIVVLIIENYDISIQIKINESGETKIYIGGMRLS